MQIWSSDKTSILRPLLGAKTHKSIAAAQNHLVLATLALFSIYLASAALAWGVEPYANDFSGLVKNVSDVFFLLGGIIVVVTDFVAVVKIITS
jgi:hypothetical protein